MGDLGGITVRKLKNLIISNTDFFGLSKEQMESLERDTVLLGLFDSLDLHGFCGLIEKDLGVDIPPEQMARLTTLNHYVQ